MALLKCPDCGNMVSDRALFCTKCGCPIDYIIEESRKQNTNKDKPLVKNITKKEKSASEKICVGTELWHEKYGIGIVSKFEDSESGKIIFINFYDDEHKFLYSASIGVHLFTLDKVPKNSRYYKVARERIERKRKEGLLLKRQERLLSRDSAFISCEDEIENDEKRKIKELEKTYKSDFENTRGVDVHGVEEIEEDEFEENEINWLEEFPEYLDEDNDYIDDEIKNEYQDIEDEIKSESRDYADSMERSKDSGWFYSDNDKLDFEELMNDYGYHYCDDDCEDEICDISDDELNYGIDDYYNDPDDEF